MELIFTYVNDRTSEVERLFIKSDDITSIQTYKRFTKNSTVYLILIFTKTGNQPLVLTFNTIEERDAFFDQLTANFSPTTHEIQWRWGMT